MRHPRLSMVAVCGVVLGSCESFTAVPSPTTYAATLDADAVRPAATESEGVGVFSATHRHTEQRLEYLLAWKDLSSVVTGAHIHGPGDENGVAQILVDFGAAGASAEADTVLGHIVMTGEVIPTVSADSLRKLLNAGHAYVDVHSTDLPDGEIRAQIRRTN